MAAPKRVKFELKNRNWNSLNQMMNSSDDLQGKLDKAAVKIQKATKKNVAATGSSSAKWLADKAKVEKGNPNSAVKIAVRFVSLPGIGFEMRYNSLRKGAGF